MVALTNIKETTTTCIAEIHPVTGGGEISILIGGKVTEKWVHPSKDIWELYRACKTNHPIHTIKFFDSSGERIYLSD